MILTDKQAHFLVHLLQDTLKITVVGYLSTTMKDRLAILNEIMNQQSDTPIQLTDYNWGSDSKKTEEYGSWRK